MIIWSAAEAVWVKYAMPRSIQPILFRRERLFYSDRAHFMLTIPNLNYQNEKIKAILEENDRDQDREQVGDQVRVQDRVQVRDQVKELVREQVVGQVTVGEIIEYCKLPRTRAEIQDYCGLVSRRSFNENHLKPMLEAGILKMTIPDKPNSKNQRYYSEYET